MEDGVCDGSIVHQYSNAPADANDQGHAQQIRAAAHEGLRDFHLPLAVQQADHHAAHQEQRAELREPPSQRGKGQSHLVKGDHSVDHDQKDQGEQDHDGLAFRGEFHRVVHGHLKPSAAHPHHGPGRVLLHPGGIGHDVPDGSPLEDHPLDDPQQDAVSQGHPGKAGGDARGKGVYRGADDSGAGSQ